MIGRVLALRSPSERSLGPRRRSRRARFRRGRRRLGLGCRCRRRLGRRQERRPPVLVLRTLWRQKRRAKVCRRAALARGARIFLTTSHERWVVESACVPEVVGSWSALFPRQVFVAILVEGGDPQIVIRADTIIDARVGVAAAQELGRVTLADEELPAERAGEAEIRYYFLRHDDCYGSGSNISEAKRNITRLLAGTNISERCGNGREGGKMRAAVNRRRA